MKNDPGTPQFNDLTTGIRLVKWAAPFDARPHPELSDVLAARHFEHGHNLRIWEPLLTKAPSPARCRPHCCYSRTVIFYASPHITVRGYPSRWSNGAVHQSDRVFAEYDQVDSRLSRDDVVGFDGHDWVVREGLVAWRRRRWWMLRWARRCS